MWNPSYFVATVSDTLEENIKEYISNMKEDNKCQNQM